MTAYDVDQLLAQARHFLVAHPLATEDELRIHLRHRFIADDDTSRQGMAKAMCTSPWLAPILLPIVLLLAWHFPQRLMRFEDTLDQVVERLREEESLRTAGSQVE